MIRQQGSRQQPFCRFSKTAVAAVQKTGVPFETFDIFTVWTPFQYGATCLCVSRCMHFAAELHLLLLLLSDVPLITSQRGRELNGRHPAEQDDEVREGLKEYSNWPTFPQLYFRCEGVHFAFISHYPMPFSQHRGPKM